MTEKPEEEKLRGIIENTGILNLKDVSEEDIEQIEGIKNSGIIIAPKELIGKISAKIIVNTGLTVPYIEGMRLYCGETSINADTLRNLEEPIDILQAGRLVFEKDVTPELILQKVKSFHNIGKTEVPSNAHGALMSKCLENMGIIEKV